MASVGEMLRDQRLRRGLRFEQIAAQTKIGVDILSALEEEKFEHLPGGAYRRSFLRQYAQALGLNEDEVITTFKQQFAEEELPLPQPPKEHPRSLMPLVWLVVMVVTCFGVYRYLQNGHPLLPETAAASAASQPHPHPVSKARPQPQSPPQAIGQAARDANPEAQTQPGDPAGKVPQAPPEPSPMVASAVPPASDAAHAVRVSFAASQPVWLSINCDGRQAFSGTLEGSQTRVFDAATKMTVLIGNAGGLTISLNGKQVGPIGAQGEIQLLELTPNGAHVVQRRSAPRPVSPDASPRG